MSDPWIIVGLGNPGRIHQESRHNVGLMAIDALAGLVTFEKEGLSLVHRMRLGGEAVVLAKPQTYMDRCGEAIGDLLTAYRASAARLIVVCDDGAIPFGFILVRSRGHHGGHSGMRAIIDFLQATEVARVKIGIGLTRAPHVGLAVVRDDFAESERTRLSGVFRGVRAALEVMVGGQVDRAMSLYNRRDKPIDEVVPASTP